MVGVTGDTGCSVSGTGGRGKVRIIEVCISGIFRDNFG